MKKGALEWDQIAKLIIAVLLLAVLLALIIVFKDKIIELFDKLKNMVMFR